MADKELQERLIAIVKTLDEDKLKALSKLLDEIQGASSDNLLAAYDPNKDPFSVGPIADSDDLRNE